MTKTVLKQEIMCHAGFQRDKLSRSAVWFHVFMSIQDTVPLGPFLLLDDKN